MCVCLYKLHANISGGSWPKFNFKIWFIFNNSMLHAHVIEILFDRNKCVLAQKFSQTYVYMYISITSSPCKICIIVASQISRELTCGIRKLLSDLKKVLRFAASCGYFSQNTLEFNIHYLNTRSAQGWSLHIWSMEYRYFPFSYWPEEKNTCLGLQWFPGPGICTTYHYPCHRPLTRYVKL